MPVRDGVYGWRITSPRPFERLHAATPHHSAAMRARFIHGLPRTEKTNRTQPTAMKQGSGPGASAHRLIYRSTPHAVGRNGASNRPADLLHRTPFPRPSPGENGNASGSVSRYLHTGRAKGATARAGLRVVDISEFLLQALFLAQHLDTAAYLRVQQVTPGVAFQDGIDVVEDLGHLVFRFQRVFPLCRPAATQFAGVTAQQSAHGPAASRPVTPVSGSGVTAGHQQ